MFGSLMAFLAILTAILSFFVKDPSIILMLFLSGCAALLAAWKHGRPSFLLVAHFSFLLAFFLQPQALHSLLQRYDVAADFGNHLHLLLAGLGFCLLLGLLFFVSCRSQSGGVFLSALEASEDFEKMVALAGRSCALLFIPLLILPVYFMLQGGDAKSFVNLGPVSWQGDVLFNIAPETRPALWLLALVMLGGLGAAHMQNAHHRYMPASVYLTFRQRACLELIGSILLLLPICGFLMLLGWQNVLGEADPFATDLLLARSPFDIEIADWMLYLALPLAFVLLAFAAVSVTLRSIVYLLGPDYLRKRAASHVQPADQALSQTSSEQAVGTKDRW